MGETTAISWCDHTFNPWIGCTNVSPACDHCYAEALAKRYGWAEWGAGKPRKRTSEANWRKPLAWDRAAKKAGVRRRVFCASLADVFDNQVPAEWRADLWRLIEATPDLDWLLLTKRPQNAARMIIEARRAVLGANVADEHLHWPWPNVWLGTTAENQVEADRRIPVLLSVPAKVHFLSCEPLLGPLDVSRYLYRSSLVHWVIAGGESGPGARPSNPDWIRSLRDQCTAAGVAFHFKQWGAAQKGAVLDGREHYEFPVPA